VFVNKTCFECEMQSRSSIVTNDLDLNFVVTALHKSDSLLNIVFVPASVPRVWLSLGLTIHTDKLPKAAKKKNIK
jgi:hypothetical protein